jgi:hypothetical protein
MDAEINQSGTTCECAKVHSRTLSECPNYPIFPPSNALTIKTDKVLSEILIETNVESDIILPEPALEIKRIGKTVELKQCELLLNTNKVFISGYVVKNIEYATVKSASDGNVCGDIKHSTVKVPFECTTAISVIPVGGPTVSGQFNFNLDNCKNKKLFNAKEFVTISFLNERPTCEPVAALIVDEEIFKKEDFGFGDCPKDTFRKFTEKMVIILQIKILQKQQIPIPQQSALFRSQQSTPSTIMEQLIETLEEIRE